VVYLKKLIILIREEVVEKVDHKNLNVDVDFMQGKMASTEILAMEFFRILAPHILAMSNNQAKLHSIKLYETPRNYVEYLGE
jgi:6-pyruvoyltetrahydropterin/6-carboxytetrahydropterin synthase